jgi:hypothetical protein
MIKEEILGEIKDLDKDVVIVYHDNNTHEEFQVQRLFQEDSKIFFICNEHAFRKEPSVAKVSNLRAFLDFVTGEEFVFHDAISGKETQICDWHFDARENELLVIGNSFDKTKVAEFCKIFEDGKDEWPLLYGLLHRCDCEKCSSGRSCLGPPRRPKPGSYDDFGC